MTNKLEINHALLFYSELTRLLPFSPYYESTVTDFLEEFNYILEKESVIFSSTTSDFFRLAINGLQEYYRNHVYLKNPVFKFLDYQYTSFLESNILPLLNSVKKDFKSQNVFFYTYTFEGISKPSDEEILKNVKALYIQLQTKK